MKRYIWLVLAFLLAPFQPFAPASAASPAAALRFLSPVDGARWVLPGSMVTLRLDGALNPRSLSAAEFTVTGSTSGRHSGSVQLATDGQTFSFKPDRPFASGETVTVVVGPGLTTRAGAAFGGLRSGFSITPGQLPLTIAQQQALELDDGQPLAANPSAAPSAPGALALHPQDDVTFPDNFPGYTVTVPANDTAPGLLFSAPSALTTTLPGFLFIAKDNGAPVYWRAMPAGSSAFDFKEQPNGQLSYFSSADMKYHLLDNTYTEVRTISAVNGYTADLHELQILPNGDALFDIYDTEPYDLTPLGGPSNGAVINLVIQELDPQNNLVFQWRSQDPGHFLITDTYQLTNTQTIDYVHGNALALANDGNLLLSSRHLDEITKIDHSDGHIIWRLGGKNNQFPSLPDGTFTCQHDIRQLPNGDLTLFDNHNNVPCSASGGPSRAMEFQIDEAGRVVTATSQYQNPLGNFSPFTGSNQRLPDGHRLIGWGFSHPDVTEVLTDGTKLFEMTFAPAYFSYRSFRFLWYAVPAAPPTLVLTGSTPSLYFSWNGAVDVASYNIYGGFGAGVLIGTQPRTGFEDHVALSSLPPGYCAFRVQPVDAEARPQIMSNFVYSSPSCGPLFLPTLFR